jgi:glycosyltransferase involved in cell wall biosynthesis
MSDVSIVIATHNRAALLERTISSFRDLAVPAGVIPEVVVVASGCCDHTVEAARRAASRLPWPLHVIDEPQPGLSLARNRGVNAASGNLIAFLDDDVWVERTWLGALVDAARTQPANIFAGRVSLEWASSQPAWSSPDVERLLSVNDLGSEPREIARSSAVVGANFAIRRTVIDSVGQFSPGLGRRGQDLLSGEDSEFVARALASGHRAFYVPRMAVRHWIPQHRASIGHVKALAFSRGRTRVLLQRVTGQKTIRACAVAGISRLVLGTVREFQSWVLRDQSRRVAAGLIRQRGLGMLCGLLQTER